MITKFFRYRFRYLFSVPPEKMKIPGNSHIHDVNHLLHHHHHQDRLPHHHHPHPHQCHVRSLGLWVRHQLDAATTRTAIVSKIS